MDYFSEIPEGQAIICRRGAYRQTPLFTRAGKIYAKYGAGFVRLHQRGGTSEPIVRWYQIDVGEANYSERNGSVFYHPEVAVAAE